MMGKMELSRRGFLSLSAGTGLTVGFGVLPALGAAAPGFGPWIRIAPDGMVTALTNVSDIGQGTNSALAQAVAEELAVPLASVRMEMAPVEQAFHNKSIGNYAVYGSIGLRTNLRPLRLAAAGARQMLAEAAAARFGVPVDQVVMREAKVLHAASGRSLPYTELLTDAAKLSPPAEPKLTPRTEWKVLGQPLPRQDIPGKVDGSTVYGLDVRLPGMLTAVVTHAPTFGGTLVSVDEAPALAVRGVRKVVRLTGALAVVADGYWPASKGLAALSPQWAPGPNAGINSDSLSRQLRDAAMAGKGYSFPGSEMPGTNVTATAQALAGAAHVVDTLFEVPFLAHATMEPMHCTVQLRADGAEIWLSTQTQSDTQAAVATVLGFDPVKVKVNATPVGGGFGRRLEHDFALQAAYLAKALAADGVTAPVKMVWPRETDMRAGYYRPAVASRVQLALGVDGMPLGMRCNNANPSLLEHTGLTIAGGRSAGDWSVGMGIVRQSYAIPALHLTWTRVDPGVPVGFWRSVGASQNGFFLEVSIDQAARHVGVDPVDYRRRLLAGKDRALTFLDKLAKAAGWGRTLPSGHALGFAMGEANNAISGHVVELSIPEPGKFRLHRIWAAIDPGVTANPNAVQAQMMGGTIFGLSAALAGEITVKDGMVEQSNFDSYPLATLAQVPPMEVLVIGNNTAAGGVGEEGVPSIAPAIANALFALTGKPITRLPLTRAGWTMV
ncbi:MAG: molybdopterin cofactor-binding domain-containing protein [Niveispirillum sp.]|uniref:xanthine dehydrogenase family protein molybdopterin-binding subunit n=1 Tax=Niveispirillum sp. TaxID=1917217 RepID=UPI003BA83461